MAIVLSGISLDRLRELSIYLRTVLENAFLDWSGT